ncbi:hypoxanthine phosphoribosyltransferase [uncultured Acetobacteroides sp.]|uniref:hypoxanthine phosphoribosyltransferase n=1 Tax=uncultured Acetobacteroides sp. TaxID=1760811 RepID=UPI0029F4B357|nr:hypoxanthine phosphoribosyltransferase [uncultured Acetobacteroides sp.]
MERIKLHDKVFEVSIPSDRIQEAVRNVANQINSEYTDADCPIFLSVLNGSFMFAADLIKNINFQCEISFTKLASYNGTSSTGKVNELIGLTKSLKDRVVIIVEDIIDTGTTLEKLLEVVGAQEPREVKIATFLFKPDAYKKDLKIDYVAMEIPNDFIVGYGLDYQELGRNYKSIYTVVE